MAKNKISKAAIWVILGLLFIGLAGFGATNFGGSIRVVGQVGDTEIGVNQYAQAVQRELRAMAQAGTPMTFSQARSFGIDQAILGRLIGVAALENETAKLGISVGDKTVGDQILEIPSFRGADGNFNREAYEMTLRNNGVTIAEFEDRVRADTARNILEASVVGGIAVPGSYTQTIYNWARETRDITWSILGPEDLEAPLPEPTEEILRAFHADNPARFTVPETRIITYAWITPQMLLDTVAIDEDALRQLYESRSGDYIRPERRLVERLVFPNADAAEAAKARIEAGEVQFEDVVADRGLTLDDIDLGDVTVADLGDAGEGVFALDDTGVVGPLPSPLGPALFRVNAILSASETTLEEARPELEAELASDRARRLIDDMFNEVDDLLAGGATLEELAEETELALGQIGWRQDVEGGIADYLEFRDAALLVSEGDFPELIEIEEGGIFAIRLDEIRPPELQSFEEIRDDVIAEWEAAETRNRLTDRIQAARQGIEAGGEMAGQDLPLRTERGITRDAFLERAPQGMVEGIFQMDEDDIRVFQTPDGAALVRLDAITQPDATDPEAAALIREFSLQASQSMAADALQLFVTRIQNTAGIQINQQALNAVNAQFN
ncbi:peptidylprolyl isomerase [Ovoidimarina sediminis]|uniref:peptidylprolyl isomerase n=1 Tax=Ovoidimarina sediminis TaxID=3079856 RepID=UPI00290CF38C|nr:SurA N-terminal domain-containing protein [Rhodophyticola sp. MJ-SS7]MDU8942172.1 SurA N-terminal domain-containing protein [Rhodophyticola sp. MJ-SS7]